MSDKKTLDLLAEQFEVLYDAAMEVDGETFDVGVHGTVYYQGVILPEITLWSSEEDEREWDDEKDDYVETVQEYVFRQIEATANKMLKTVEKARELLDAGWPGDE